MDVGDPFADAENGEGAYPVTVVEDGDDDDSSSSDGSDMEVTVGADCLYGLSFSLRPRVLKTPCVGCDELYVVVDNLP